MDRSARGTDKNDTIAANEHKAAAQLHRISQAERWCAKYFNYFLKYLGDLFVLLKLIDEWEIWEKDRDGFLDDCLVDSLTKTTVSVFFS